MRQRVLVVIGTRPEAIKMAPVVRALADHADRVETRVALTGQHTTLVDQVLEAFDLSESLAYDLDLEPYDLSVMKAGQSLYDVVQGALAGLRGVLEDFRPDLALVEGDTATVFAASLAAFFEKVKVGHVEAGLRTRDKWSPFPEELFRRLTDVVADHHFAPTPVAASALLAEGVPSSHVHVTGNTVVDALLAAAELERPVQNATLQTALDDKGKRLVLLTAHRRESFGPPLREVFDAVREVADRVDDIRIVYPVHPNPRVAGPAREMLAGHPRIALTDPLDYFDMVAAMRGAALILTDSGGIQEEAPTFGTPVLVLREVTERPEGVAAGVAQVVGTNRARIVERATAALARGSRHRAPANPYGDGRAGERIADIVVADLCGVERRTKDWSP